MKIKVEVEGRKNNWHIYYLDLCKYYKEIKRNAVFWNNGTVSKAEDPGNSD